MSKKPVHTAKTAKMKTVKPLDADNLKLINGIGPSVENHLHGVGIYTFSQLATLSPADIAASVSDLAGMTSERIIKQDWIGQARKLAAGFIFDESERADQEHKQASAFALTEQHNKNGTAMIPQANHTSTTEPRTSIQFRAEYPHEDILSAEVAEENKATEDPFHHAIFTVDLLLTEDHMVHSTHVVHVQSTDEFIWHGWQETQLLDFLVQRSRLNRPLIESSVSASESSATTNMLHVRGIEIVLHDEPRSILPFDLPFHVRLTLDLTDIVITDTLPCHYTTTIYGKRLGSSTRQILGETNGTFMSSSQIILSVGCTGLERGTYSVEGVVSLTLPTGVPTSPTELTAHIAGNFLQVY